MRNVEVWQWLGVSLRGKFGLGWFWREKLKVVDVALAVVLKILLAELFGGWFDVVAENRAVGVE